MWFIWLCLPALGAGSRRCVYDLNQLWYLKQLPCLRLNNLPLVMEPERYSCRFQQS